MIIIDTDVLIEIFDKHSKKGDLALFKLESSHEEIVITPLTLHEILYGIYKYGKKKSKLSGLKQLETIQFTSQDAMLSARLELDCEKKGKMVSRIDSMIAAMAINRSAKLFTFNKRHFQSFSKLKLL